RAASSPFPTRRSSDLPGPLGFLPHSDSSISRAGLLSDSSPQLSSGDQNHSPNNSTDLFDPCGGAACCAPSSNALPREALLSSHTQAFIASSCLPPPIGFLLSRTPRSACFSSSQFPAAWDRTART